ncbi:hypothetical protein [Acinetobacter pragensis]|uniref:hypothetical protein n=1 Tax=Acinetobacter pragensis TaxID=1806892 RepID=UPI0033408C8E
MSNFDNLFVVALCSIIGVIIFPFFQNFNIWKVTLFSIVVSTFISAIVLIISFYIKNIGVNGSWGENGILLELMSPRVWDGGLILGVIITIMFVGSILLSKI